MIFDYFRRRRDASRQARERAMKKWQESYFTSIVFPIVILNDCSYEGVHDLEEYFYDVDINIFFVHSGSELVDSVGQKYSFKQIGEKERTKQWVPDFKTGTMDIEELKERITPLLSKRSDRQGIAQARTIKGVIDLVLSE